MSYSRKRKERIRIVEVKKVLESDIEEMKRVLSMKDGKPKRNAMARFLFKEPPQLKLTDKEPQVQIEDSDTAASDSTKGRGSG